MRGQRGFTLIEMAIVLAIVGLLVGGGIMAVGPIVERARLNQTNANLDQIENALVLFAIRQNANSRLPCPADGSLAPGAANYGLAQPTGSTMNCTVVTTNSVIPWRTLGLDETYSVDGWGNRISYFPANPTINGGISSLTTDAALYRAGTTYPSGTYLTVNDAAANALTPPTAADRAAYVLISHGKSGYYGWKKSGVQTAVPANRQGGNKTSNNTASAGAGTFIQNAPILTNNNTYFDDIVRWRSPAMVIQLCGSGGCGNP